jgi:hypothetical protein
LGFSQVFEDRIERILPQSASAQVNQHPPEFIARGEKRGRDRRRQAKFTCAQSGQNLFGGVAHNYQRFKPKQSRSTLDRMECSKGAVEQLGIAGRRLELDQVVVESLQEFLALHQEVLHERRILKKVFHTTSGSIAADSYR